MESPKSFFIKSAFQVEDAGKFAADSQTAFTVLKLLMKHIIQRGTAGHA